MPTNGPAGTERSTGDGALDVSRSTATQPNRAIGGRAVTGTAPDFAPYPGRRSRQLRSYGNRTRLLKFGPSTPNLNDVVLVNVEPGLSTTDGQLGSPMWFGASG